LRNLTLVLAILLVGALVAAGFLTFLVVRDARASSSRADALRTARQLTVNFTTLDYRTFDRDASTVVGLSSGDFRAQFRNATAGLKQQVTANKTVSKGEVLEAGLVSFDPDSARALVVADASVTNVSAPKGAVRHYRMQLDLVRERAGWRVVDLQFVG
jgi:Mce-associated membrane protein